MYKKEDYVKRLNTIMLKTALKTLSTANAVPMETLNLIKSFQKEELRK